MFEVQERSVRAVEPFEDRLSFPEKLALMDAIWLFRGVRSLRGAGLGLTGNAAGLCLCLDQQPWPTRARARRAIVEYIAWFNGTRLHSALTPDEFERPTERMSSRR